VYAESLASAGTSQEICEGDTVTLGGNNLNATGVTYNWTPNIDLSSNSAPKPQAWPALTTVYTLTVNGPNCPSNVSSVTITVHPLPAVNAGPDVTIYSGQATQLNGSGATTYFWTPGTSLNYTNIPNPDANPTYTIQYVLIGTDQYGCVNYDGVVVTVLETDSLFLYNTFTPNGDGDNDNWVIGNLDKFPDNTLTIYNRYGRQVYYAHPYSNNWHGKSGGEELPAATYYYILDKGDGSKELHGAVTILR
jgi:gliding motility-associated-like protein